MNVILRNSNSAARIVAGSLMVAMFAGAPQVMACEEECVAKGEAKVKVVTRATAPKGVCKAQVKGKNVYITAPKSAGECQELKADCYVTRDSAEAGTIQILTAGEYQVASPPMAWTTVGDCAGVPSIGLAGESGNIVFVSGDEKVESHTIKVMIKDGEKTIVLDGDEVPEDHLIFKDGTIIILGEDGEEVRTINIGGKFDIKSDSPGLGYWYGGNELKQGEMKFFGEPEPKVMLGVHLDEPGPALIVHLGLEAGETTMIPSLYEGLPADKAGLEEYDIIVKIDGETPADPKTLRTILADKEPGDVIKLTVINKGDYKKVKVRLDEYDREAMEVAGVIGVAPDEVTIDVEGFFGPKDFQWTVPKMNDVFIDKNRRVFEVQPDMRFGPDHPLKLRERFKYQEAEEDVELDERLETLHERLAELEEMLDELLDKAANEPRR